MVSYALQVAEKVDSLEATTYQEAINCTKSNKWIVTMNEEMKSLKKIRLGIWLSYLRTKQLLVPNGSSRKKLGMRYKVRLVAKGYSQKKGVDYNDSFSLIVRHISIRVLLALVVIL